MNKNLTFFLQTISNQFIHNTPDEYINTLHPVYSEPAIRASFYRAPLAAGVATLEGHRLSQDPPAARAREQPQQRGGLATWTTWCTRGRPLHRITPTFMDIRAAQRTFFI